MSNDRRLFITAGAEHWQLFSFVQNKNDASIYVGSSNFAEINWLTIDPSATENERLRILESPGGGKLSLHATGLTHVRGHDGATDAGLVFNGNPLKQSNTLGVRHLFTVLISEPEHLPPSPAFNRKSDQSVHAEKLLPYVLVFWAVPSTRELTVEVSASFNADDLETVPPETGWGAFGLAVHSVVWFAYRTKNMERWPRHPQVCFHDGHAVPFLIGTSVGGCRLELRSPKYSLTDDLLSIHA